MVITLFLNHDGDVLPVMIHEENAEKFIGLGYRRTFAEAAEAAEETEEKAAEKKKKLVDASPNQSRMNNER